MTSNNLHLTKIIQLLKYNFSILTQISNKISNIFSNIVRTLKNNLKIKSLYKNYP